MSLDLTGFCSEGCLNCVCAWHFLSSILMESIKGVGIDFSIESLIVIVHVGILLVSAAANSEEQSVLKEQLKETVTIRLFKQVSTSMLTWTEIF